ncbi:MAG: universal stress protein [Nitrospirae bacterium]|nr:universal stress protein [Nitrospirota bacterium]
MMATEKKSGFKVLICIDGSAESLKGIHYGARLGSGTGAEITILHIRTSDSHDINYSPSPGTNSNATNWGMSVAELRYLEEARQALVSYEWMSGIWTEDVVRYFDGDHLNNFQICYKTRLGQKINLKLKSGHNVAAEILDEAHGGAYGLIIIGASKFKRSLGRVFVSSEVQKVVVHAPCSVLVARDLHEVHGHLICLDGSERSYEMMIKDFITASLCSYKVSLISVAPTPGDESAHNNIIAEGLKRLKKLGYESHESIVVTGDPVENIVEYGRKYSVIVVAANDEGGLRRFFMGGTSFNIVLNAENSVMVVR